MSNGYGVATGPDTLRVERDLPGPIERVWSYLTESEKRGKWLASGTMDVRAGGALELVFKHHELSAEPTPGGNDEDGFRAVGRILACDPPRRLAFTWEQGPSPSEVIFELAERGDRVLLTLTHTKLADRKSMVEVAGGWHAHLDILEDQLNGVEPRGFWSNHNRVAAEYEARIPA